MTNTLLVVGAGGFGREVLDVVSAINSAAPEAIWDVVGVVDDAPSEANIALLEKREAVLLGATADVIPVARATHYVVGIGAPRVRRLIADRFDAAGYEAATLVHPTVTTGFDATFGEGTVICAGARLTTNIRLGRHVHINPSVTVGHDTIIGDFVSINPSASISGDCVVEDGALIGVAGVVLNGLNVGADAIVGGSACVVRDVPPGETVKGVPAR